MWDEIYYSGHIYRANSTWGKKTLRVGVGRAEQTAGVHMTMGDTLSQPILLLPRERSRLGKMASGGHSPPTLLPLCLPVSLSLSLSFYLLLSLSGLYFC